MVILGIDYGRRKLGLALSGGTIAAPHSVVRITSWQDAFNKIAKVARVEKVEKAVVGISEGEMAKEQEIFAQELRKVVGLPIELWDETLTSKEAQVLASQAGLGQKKRHELEDAFAACLMLQSFLEAHDKKGT